MNIVIFIIILLVLVIVHEFGHFFSAKRFGIRVDEFGFGFPPKLFGKKFGETEYTFNLLPLGGVVKIYGETPDEENMNGPDAARSFVNKPKYKQAIVLVAGVVSNFLLAWLLFSIGFMSGLPSSVGSEGKNYQLSDLHLVVVSVSSHSPAEASGLKAGDKIISLKSGSDDLVDINPETLRNFIVNHNDQELAIGYLRGTQTETSFVNIVPVASATDGKPSIGIAMDEIGIAKLPIFQAFYEGMKLTLFVAKSTVVGLYTLIVNGLQAKGSFDAVTGPVGMVGIVGDAYKLGFVYLLSFSALISINLAVINLLPFPALDGGRLFFLLIEKVKGSAINPKVANTANMVGFGVLILLMLVVTYHDVIKLF
ncbi:MAG: site-2 protease family protein [Candidatus Paceibacterota bacterium]